MSSAPTGPSGWSIASAWRALVACAVLGLLSGCGATLVYPRLDTLAEYYFQDLVSLDKAQAQQLSRTLSANLEWHRSSELAKYASFLRGLAGPAKPESQQAEVARLAEYLVDLAMSRAMEAELTQGPGERQRNRPGLLRLHRR